MATTTKSASHDPCTFLLRFCLASSRRESSDQTVIYKLTTITTNDGTSTTSIFAFPATSSLLRLGCSSIPYGRIIFDASLPIRSVGSLRA